MKTVHLFPFVSACLGLALTACLPAPAPDRADAAQLTPFLTSTPPVPTPSAAAPTETVQPFATATPELFTHEIAQQETISSIALRYGVTIDAIIAANPDVNPRSLKIGTLLTIPVVSAAPALDPSSEALDLELSDAVCLPTHEGGLWCYVMVSNPLNQPADGINVAFTLSDQTSNQTQRQNVPTLLNRLDPARTLPALTYFPPPVPRVFSVTADLFSALPLSDAIRSYVDVTLQNEQLVMQGSSARASAQLIPPAPENLPANAAVEAWIGASAYDTQGQLLGARRIELTLSQEDIISQTPVEISLLVYSSAGNINSLRLQAEAFILDE